MKKYIFNFKSYLKSYQSINESTEMGCRSGYKMIYLDKDEKEVIPDGKSNFVSFGCVSINDPNKKDGTWRILKYATSDPTNFVVRYSKEETYKDGTLIKHIDHGSFGEKYTREYENGMENDIEKSTHHDKKGILEVEQSYKIKWNDPSGSYNRVDCVGIHKWFRPGTDEILYQIDYTEPGNGKFKYFGPDGGLRIDGEATRENIANPKACGIWTFHELDVKVRYRPDEEGYNSLMEVYEDEKGYPGATNINGTPLDWREKQDLQSTFSGTIELIIDRYESKNRK